MAQSKGSSIQGLKSFVAICALLVVGSSALAQDLKETHGKTNAQILAMGYGKWYAFYTGKEGETTQGMARSGYFFADALAWRNRGLLAKQSKTTQTKFKRLESLLKTFGMSVIEVNRALNGGGTLWQLTASSDGIAVQETMYALIAGKSKTAKPMVVSMVQKELVSLKKAVDSAPESTWQYEFTKEATLADVKVATTTYESIVALAKGLDRKKSDHTLAYCLRVMSHAQMGN